MSDVADNSILVKCNGAGGCGHQWRLEGFEERTLTRDHVSHGFECPACGYWYQAYITDAKARRMQDELAKAQEKVRSLPLGTARTQASARAQRLADQLKEHMTSLKANRK